MGKVKPLLLGAMAAISLGLGTFAGTATALASTPHFTAKQVAARLLRLGCHATPQSPTMDMGFISPRAELDCSVNGEDVTIDQYANAEQVAVNLGMFHGIGCDYAKAFGITTVAWVQEANVTVSPQTVGTARQLQHALGGGRLKVVKC